jgi:hypothetical protein
MGAGHFVLAAASCLFCLLLPAAEMWKVWKVLWLTAVVSGRSVALGLTAWGLGFRAEGVTMLESFTIYSRARRKCHRTQEAMLVTCI